MTRWLKITGAVLVASCLVLPISSCTEYRDDAGKLVLSGAEGSMPPGAHAVTTRDYLLEKVSLGDLTSWLYVAAFIWPAAFLLHARMRPAARLTLTLWFVEPLLLAGPLYVIFMFSIIKTHDVGSYVGWAGLAVYFCGWIGEAVGRWRVWKRHRLTTA
jgi:hypothetical protein